jgi:transcriptional regulator with XRE-family HTH domain
MKELGWSQRELARRSQVAQAIIREIQHHVVERRRSPRTLQAISSALGWGLDHLTSILQGSLLFQSRTDRGLDPFMDMIDRQLDDIEDRLRMLVNLRSTLVARGQDSDGVKA